MHMKLTAAIERLQRSHPQKAPVSFSDELGKVSLIFDSHAEFLTHYQQIDCDFVFDKLSGLYFVGTAGKHVDLMAALFRYYGGSEPDLYEAADQFILRSLGMFKSRASHRIFRSYGFAVPAELRPIQRDIEVLS